MDRAETRIGSKQSGWHLRVPPLSQKDYLPELDSKKRGKDGTSGKCGVKEACSALVPTFAQKSLKTGQADLAKIG